MLKNLSYYCCYFPVLWSRCTAISDHYVPLALSVCAFCLPGMSVFHSLSGNWFLVFLVICPSIHPSQIPTFLWNLLLPSDTISTPALGGNAELFLWLMISWESFCSQITAGFVTWKPGNKFGKKLFTRSLLLKVQGLFLKIEERPWKIEFGLEKKMKTGETEFSGWKDWFAINILGSRVITLEKCLFTLISIS